MNKQYIEVDFKKYIDYLMIGEKATSYRNPLIIEKINIFDDKVCIYTKNINTYNIVFDKKNFIEYIKKFLQENVNE